MSYITEGDLENHILQDIDNSFSSWIASVILMVESYIEKFTGIDFENSVSSTRYFDGYGEDVLFIGDFQSVATVQILDSTGTAIQTLTVNTDYVLYPYNDSVKNALLLMPGGQRVIWPTGRRTVLVTGVFGYATPPADIKMAAVRMAAKIINEGLKGGQVASETLGSYSVSYEQMDDNADSLGIKHVLNSYRPQTFL